jgi:predicted phage terminase large subunit-like protein
MTPRPIPKVRELLKRNDVIITRGSLFENRENLAASFIQTVLDMYEGTRLGRQEIEGELLEDVVGALWNHDMLAKLRIRDKPFLSRVGIAVDPATSAPVDMAVQLPGQKKRTPNTSETGIVVAGRTREGKAIVLEDASMRGSPNEWARKVAEMYQKHEADFVVAERNQGGEMVRQIMHNVDPTMRIELVHAKKGKIARAEPVAAAYEQGKVFHLGAFPAMEDQMCTYVPGEVDESPDRMDALVYIIAKLIVEPKMRAGSWGRRAA